MEIPDTITANYNQLLSLLLLTVSAHAREGYSSQFVCLFLISKTKAFSRLKCELGDNLCPLNVALF